MLITEFMQNMEIKATYQKKVFNNAINKIQISLEIKLLRALDVVLEITKISYRHEHKKEEICYIFMYFILFALLYILESLRFKD